MLRSLVIAALACSVLAQSALWAAELDGRKLFKKRCGTCHKVTKVGQGLKGFTDEERLKHFDRFLSAHHAPDRAERLAIIDYMNGAMYK